MIIYKKEGSKLVDISRYSSASETARSNFVEELLGRVFNRKPAKSLRNSVDGSFAVDFTSTPRVKELVRYAYSLGLTVQGDGTCRKISASDDINEAILGDTLLFGTVRARKFDIIYIPTSKIRGGVSELYGELARVAKEGPIYDSISDFDDIKAAIRELAKEKAKLTNEYCRSLANDDLPLAPTFSELKSQEIGRKHAAEFKMKSADQKRETTWKDRACTSDLLIRRNNGEVLEVNVQNDFVQIGYNFIPVYENKLNVFYV